MPKRAAHQKTTASSTATAVSITNARRALPDHLLLRRDFYDALLLIDRSGVAETMEEATSVRGPSGRRMGRPRTFTMRALVVVLLVLALQRREPTILEAHHLVESLPDELLAEIGLERHKDHVIALSKFDHLWNRFADAINDCPAREGKRLWVAPDGTRINVPQRRCIDRKALNPGLSDEDAHTVPSRAPSKRGESRGLSEQELERRRLLRSQWSDALLSATVPHLPYQAFACDWTDIVAAAVTYRHPRDVNGAPVRGVATRKHADATCEHHAERPELAAGCYGASSADPSAAYGHRSAKNKGLSAKPTSAQEGAGDAANDPEHTELFFGHIVHASVLVAAVDAPALPPIVYAVRGTAADAMGTVAPILNDIREVTAALPGIDADEGLGDVGYAQQGADNVHQPFADAGSYLTYDYKRHMYGPHGTFFGAPLVDGEPVCPCAPDALLRLVMPADNAPRSAWTEYRRLRKLLAPFRFRRQGKMGPDLKVRFQCPAVAGKVRCPLVERSMSLPVTADRPEIYEPPAEKLACCGTSRVASFEVGRGLRQRHLHGSEEWQKSYNRRTEIERRFSILKGSYRLDEMRFLTLAKKAVIFTLAAAALNIEELRKWERATGNSTGLLAPPAQWDLRVLTAAA